jgi:hypothetical protein
MDKSVARFRGDKYIAIHLENRTRTPTSIRVFVEFAEPDLALGRPLEWTKMSLDLEITITSHSLPYS